MTHIEELHKANSGTPYDQQMATHVACEASPLSRFLQTNGSIFIM